MSRYVDLDGLTWDGTTIASKIQEVKTSIGYMSGITIGWLWGNNVPHIDLEENNTEIYNKALDDVFKALLENTESTEKYIDSAIVVKVLKQLRKGETHGSNDNNGES